MPRQVLYFTKEHGVVRALIFNEENMFHHVDELTGVPQDIDPDSKEETDPVAQEFAQSQGVTLEHDDNLPGVYKFWR